MARTRVSYGGSVLTQPIVYPHDLIDKLFGAIVALEAAASTGTMRPSKEQLGRVLDAAWSASLLEEEGRRAVFTLAFATPRDAAQCPWTVLEFADSVPCEPNAIAKLSIATDPRETILGIRWAPQGRLEIWGLLQLEDRGPDIEPRPPFLHVTGFRPGGLVVESHGRRVLLYMNGVAHWHESGAEHIAMLLRDTLRESAAARASTDAPLAQELEHLAERLVVAGQGGTVLVSDVATPRGVHLPPGTTFRSPNTCLKDASLRGEQFAATSGTATGDGSRARMRFELARVHLRALDHVARLSNVDGAVLMLPDLSVIGFGATIDLTDETDIPPLELYDLTVSGTPPRNITVEDVPGHRHKSAVHFCAMQSQAQAAPIALAIVASQDGTLSLFGLAGGRIRVYRPFILRSVSVR
jgi:hypothetical protein